MRCFSSSARCESTGRMATETRSNQVVCDECCTRTPDFVGSVARFTVRRIDLAQFVEPDASGEMPRVCARPRLSARESYDAAREIRNGHITREEGVAVVCYDDAPRLGTPA